MKYQEDPGPVTPLSFPYGSPIHYIIPASSDYNPRVHDLTSNHKREG